jgi:hypothetical protein
MSYSKTANATLKMAGWEETVKEDIDQGEGKTTNGVYYPKRGVTISEASFTYTGDMEGTSTVLYLITYKPDGAAPVLGVERFVGSIGGREGSCVMTSIGTQSPGDVKGHAEVVAGLGTGELATLRGEMDLHIEGMSEDGYPVSLSYDID